MSKENSVRVFALGGLDEIGKNMYAVEYKDQIFVVDAGIKFPDDDMYGIDYIIPDFTYLIQNKQKVKGLFLTHGHEDHIGGIPYLLREINLPIYGSRFTIGLVKGKIEEARLKPPTYVEVDEESEVKLGDFTIRFFNVNHSIPDALGIIFETPEGIIVHTGDFKFDQTPIGKKASYATLAALSKQNVLALLADSTNSMRPGYTFSDSIIGQNIMEIVEQAKGRIILATFASNVHRLQQVVEAGEREGRKIALAGRSMERVFQVGQELGYINVQKDTIVPLKKVNQLPDQKVLIISTGSQGEPMAALTRMANGAHPDIELHHTDTIIISASPIPGNIKSVSRVINQLSKTGANIVYNSNTEIHASGHGSQEELKLMLNLIQPKYFVPIHGEYRMLHTHAKLAEMTGIPPENIFILDNGDQVHFTRDDAWIGGKVQAGPVFIDGRGIGDIGNVVMRDRKTLSQDGVILLVVAIDMKKRQILAGPDIITRGFVYVRESQELIDQLQALARETLEKQLSNKVTDWSRLKQALTDQITPFVQEKTGRSPMFLPIISEVRMENNPSATKVEA